MTSEPKNNNKETTAENSAQEAVQETEQKNPETPTEETANAAGEEKTPEGEDKAGQEVDENAKMAEELQTAQQQIAQLKDQLLRQMAEFDNFRKRTLKEKSELILNGGRNVLESLLPVLDDLERAQANIEKSDEIETLKEGVHLILNKLTKVLSSHGLKKIETDGAAFDTDFHEAVALVPAQDESQKNHIIDCVQPGYMLNEKVLRHAKVVVGQ